MSGFSLRVLSPRLLTKALALMDKSTAVVVGVSWVVAIAMLVIAVLSVHSAVASKKEAAEAVASEPILPAQAMSPLTARDGQAILERLQRQFPDIKFDLDREQAITVKADDGARFHQWIIALGYIDTMAPQYRWNLRDFCVGHCGQDIMKAVVTGQKISFTLPQP